MQALGKPSWGRSYAGRAARVCSCSAGGWHKLSRGIWTWTTLLLPQISSSRLASFSW